MYADPVEQGRGLGGAALQELRVDEEVEVEVEARVVVPVAVELQPPVEAPLERLPGPPSVPVP